jgi:hypothetical protein
VFRVAVRAHVTIVTAFPTVNGRGARLQFRSKQRFDAARGGVGRGGYGGGRPRERRTELRVVGGSEDMPTPTGLNQRVGRDPSHCAASSPASVRAMPLSARPSPRPRSNEPIIPLQPVLKMITM